MENLKTNKISFGDASVSKGNPVAQVDLSIGPRGGIAGTAFYIALDNQKRGDNSVLSIVPPNLMTNPPAVMFNKVDKKHSKQAVLMIEPAHSGDTAFTIRQDASVLLGPNKDTGEFFDAILCRGVMK